MFWLGIVFVCLSGILVSGQSPNCCPDGWLSFQSSCYHLTHDIYEDFFESENYCKNHGGHLVNVGSKAEDDFLKQFMARLNATIFWMGLTDEISEGRWIWRDTGLEPTYTGWSPGEPNSFQGENEDCSIFYVTTNYAWADASCLGRFPPCCEIDLSNSGGVVG